jgi:hypothetical protein
MMYQGRELQVGDSVIAPSVKLAKGIITNIEEVEVTVNWTFADDTQVSYVYNDRNLTNNRFIISPSLSLEQQILDLLG